MYCLVEDRTSEKRGGEDSDNIHDWTQEELCQDASACEELRRMEECYLAIYHAVPWATTPAIGNRISKKVTRKINGQ